MNAAVRVEASPAVTLAEAERALEAKEAGRAEQRRALASAAAVTVEARNRLAEAPGDRRLAEEVEAARRGEAIETESLAAWDRNVEDAQRQAAEARRAAGSAELVDMTGEATDLLSKLPAHWGVLAEIHRTAAPVVDRIEDIAEAYGELHDRARVLAARLGVTNPIRSVPLAVVRVAAGLYLADAIGVPEVEAEELRTNLGLGRAVRDLAAVRLDAADLVPAAERLMAELDAAMGATAARWLEPLRDVSWNAHESERERHEAAEALLAELEEGGAGG